MCPIFADGLQLKEDTASPPQKTGRKQQRCFDAFRQLYNQERPHEALGQKPPGRQYRHSFRPYPTRLREPEYQSEVMVRRVRSNGQIKWKGELIYLSEALRGEPVGLMPQDDRFWTILYGPLLIGQLDDHTHRISQTPTKVLPMSSV